ncbi:MFS general substrate transporter [Aspergillus fijiensis CBS 313.89]|uniref:MFS general substrate transporter n=1 Tax=Aspergillus fijiensis CBS 313.89 TaxID=1448319 RepID=A0A8G1S1U9_9EURO|nr:MFS general substrate transporter [Aspergillus fijiensis CBS 313.89]RAK81850.1 MFS general substrate transporter [Aspergillus fijiensis CBS 313.89]
MSFEEKDIPAEATSSPPVVTITDRQQERLNALLEEHGATWDSPDDPHDPYNWSSIQKVSVALIVSLGQLVTLMSTSMMAAALTQIGADLHLGSTATHVTFSIFILGLVFAPFLIAALSEMYGRRPVWIASNLFYTLWNALCPVSSSVGLMTVGRFLAGSGASAGITLTGPILADMYRPEHRGRSLALATFIPYLGPALGPIIGGVISQHLPWGWLFWILSIFDAVIVLIGIFFLPECYTRSLLRKKAALHRYRQNATTAPLSSFSKHSLTLLLDKAFYQDLSARLGVHLIRPLGLLIYRPAIQVIALIMALNFAIYCLLLSTYATLWMERYGESATISSLNYIAIAIGTITASQAGGHLMDRIYRALKARNHDSAPTPEFRVPFLVPGILLIPVGIFLYGWSAEGRLHWVVVDVGTAIFVTGSFILSQGMLAYLLDEFTTHAASANAAARMLSNILGFVFPIFAPDLYAALGYGWGNSLLGFIFVAVCWPIPVILWVYGSRLRAIGRT